MDKEKLQTEQGKTYTYEPDAHTVYITDSGLAAALIVSGYNLASIVRDDKNYMEFVFSAQDGQERTIDLYRKNKLLVPARTFSETLHTLKDSKKFTHNKFQRMIRKHS